MSHRVPLDVLEVLAVPEALSMPTGAEEWVPLKVGAGVPRFSTHTFAARDLSVEGRAHCRLACRRHAHTARAAALPRPAALFHSSLPLQLARAEQRRLEVVEGWNGLGPRAFKHIVDLLQRKEQEHTCGGNRAAFADSGGRGVLCALRRHSEEPSAA